MKILKTFNEEQVTEEDEPSMLHRRAVRGVVFDDNKNIAFIFARNYNYYELPGGGVEKDETIEEGFIRECKEETGCDVKVIKEIGRILELRKRSKLINDSHCYIAKIIGDKGDVSMTEKEIEEGKEVIWVPIEEALCLIKTSDASKDIYDQYLLERDTLFMLEALNVLKTSK